MSKIKGVDEKLVNSICLIVYGCTLARHVHSYIYNNNKGKMILTPKQAQSIEFDLKDSMIDSAEIVQDINHLDEYFRVLYQCIHVEVRKHLIDTKAQQTQYIEKELNSIEQMEEYTEKFTDN